MHDDIPVEQLDRLRDRLKRWSARLHSAGLDGLVDTLLGVATPLGPLSAQLLWIAQPTLSLVVPAQDIDDLARLLDAPSGVKWLRETLFDSESGSDPDSKP
jgi:hypothetical protein